MNLDSLTHRLEQLSDKDRRLFLYKLEKVLSNSVSSQTKEKQKRLVAYVKSEGILERDTLNSFLKERLPNYMIPSTIHEVDSIPILPNGKVDRKSLIHSVKKSEVQQQYRPKESSNIEAEAKLIKIWEDVLGTQPIYKDDNFFEIGGDSILSIQIIAKARKLGFEFTANQLFEYQTISELVTLTKAETYNTKADKDINDVEKKLISIWEEVLQMSPINADDNFFEIGGDSILSIQIIAKARQARLEIKPNQLFEHQNISELSKVIGESQNPFRNTSQIKDGDQLPLTPIQHWFFETHQKAPHYWNQIFEVQPTHQLKNHLLSSISKELITKHEALRLSFLNESGEWYSKIKSVNQLNPFDDITLKSNTIEDQTAEIETRLIQLQENIDLSKGDLFKIVAVDCNHIQPNKVFLVVHHLVVDMVSWQIIFNYINARIDSKSDFILTESPNNSATIKDWSKFLNDKIHQIDSSEVSFWESQYDSNFELPSDYKSTETTYSEHTIFKLSSHLDAEMSNNLVFNTNKTYNTNTEDLLISALLQTLTKWSQQETITLGLERQGRTVEAIDFDLTETAGWFTSYFPISFKDVSYDTEKHIKTTKEQLRNIPNNGLGFGILKYLSNSKNEILDRIKPQVVFNYLGRTNSENNSNELNFSFVKEHIAKHPESERLYSIEINAYILDQKLIIDWSFTNILYNQETAKSLVGDFIKNLENIIEHCVSKDEMGYTPSDFTDVDLNQDDLDNLLSQL